VGLPDRRRLLLLVRIIVVVFVLLIIVLWVSRRTSISRPRNDVLQGTCNRIDSIELRQVAP
jgi:uncharacterized membrane protein YqiK